MEKSIRKLDLSQIERHPRAIQDQRLTQRLQRHPQRVDLHQNNISQDGALVVAEILSRNTALTFLDLSDNDLTDHGAQAVLVGLKNCRSLKELRLGNCGLGSVTGPYLATLLKDSSSIEAVRISSSSRLAETYQASDYQNSQLVLKENKLGTKGCILIFEGLKTSMSPVQKLDLSSNSIEPDASTTIKEFFQHENCIEELDVSSNPLQDEGIKNICDGIIWSMRLRHLDLSATQLSYIGASSIKKVLSAPQCMMHYLNLSHNAIGAPEVDLIIEGLRGNHSLISLNLSGNPLPGLSISRLLAKPTGVVLSRLYLSQVAAFGSAQARELGELLRTNSLRLEMLDISENNIDEAAAAYLLQSLWRNKTLSALHMRGVKINADDIKDAQLRFERAYPLFVLNIDNATNTAPSGGAATPFFASKVLSDLALVQYPKSLFLATQLHSLVLSHNNITEIPSSISMLSNLKLLDLRYNDIETLPPALGHLTQLKSLKLVPGNHIRTPADEKTLRKASENPSKLLGYLRDMEKGSEEVYRMKLMIVGQENVGKTTLLRALARKLEKASKRKEKDKWSQRDTPISEQYVRRGGTKFQKPAVEPPYLSTDGVDIQDLSIEVVISRERTAVIPPKPGEASSSATTEVISTQERKIVSLSTWDFAGQDVYYPTHQFFLADDCLYLLVWDMRRKEEDSRIGYWLQVIRASAPSASILLVGTHLDDPKCLRPGYVEAAIHDIKSKYRQFAPMIRFIVPMSSYGDLSELIISIKEVVAEQQILGQIVPSSYLELERVIALDRDNAQPGSIPIKTWEQYREVANLAGIKTDEELKRASQFLRNMGNILWFDDNQSSIKDIVITDPQFLSKVFATIVTTKQNYVKDGVLDHSNLVHIWKQFPSQMHQQLLAILEKFEINYRIDQKIARRLGSSAPGMPTRGAADNIDAFGVKGGASSIIPSLLPNQRPVMSLLWKGYDGVAEHYIRVFELPFIPKGLFSRFLVRLLHYSSHAVTFWRSGIIAAAEDSMFLVEFFESKRWIIASVKEGENPKQRFREIIEILEGLVGGYQFAIEMKRRIPCPHCLIKMNSMGINFFDACCGVGDSSPRSSFQAQQSASSRGSTGWLKPATTKWKSTTALPSSDRPDGDFSAAVAASARTPGPKIGMLKMASTLSMKTATASGSSGKIGDQRKSVSETDIMKPQGPLQRSTSLHTLEGKVDAGGLPFMFSFQRCQKVAVTGDWFIECKLGRQLVRLDTIAPDLTLSDFEGVQIKLSDLKFLVQLGKGAQGAVWKAEWRGRIVAVKELFPPAGKVSDSVLKTFDEFRREVWMMSSLRHDCIVQLLGFCVKPTNLIVMEYIPGGTLYEWLSAQKRSMSWPQRIRIAIDVALGLRFLHSASPPLMHRDMKSPNVLCVSTDPHAQIMVKIADFGLSSRLYAPALKERSQERRIGNPHWLAPEVMREEEYNEKVDVYSYGMILWELVSRELPFAKEFRENGGQQGPLEDMISRGLRPKMPASCPSGMANLIRLCWQDEASQRPTWDNVIIYLLNLAHSMGLADQMLIPDECLRSRGTRKAAERLRADSNASSSSVTTSDLYSTRTSSSNSISSETSAGPLDMLRRRSSSAEKGSILAFGTLAKAPKQLLQIPTASSSQVEALKRASVGSESDGDGSDDSIDGQRSSVELRGHSGSFLCRGRFVGVSQASTAVVSMVSVQEHPIMWIGGTDGSVAVWSTTVGTQITPSQPAHSGPVTSLVRLGGTVWSCSKYDEQVKAWVFEELEEKRIRSRAGWLTVQKFGDTKRKKRWVQVHDQTLSVHKNAKTPRKGQNSISLSNSGSKEAAHVLNLSTAQATMVKEKEIKIFHLDGRHILNLFSDSEEEIKEWYEMLKDDSNMSRARLRVTQIFHSTHPIEAMALVPSARELLCLNVKNELTVRLVEDGEVVRSTKLDSSSSPAALRSRKRTILASGKNIWIGIGSILFVLETESLKLIRKIESHEAEIVEIVAISSQKEVWTLDQKGNLFCWHASLEKWPDQPMVGRISITEGKITSSKQVGMDAWLGSETGQIYVFSTLSKKMIRVLDRNNQAPINVICAWHHTIWCADKAGKISLWS